MPVGQRTGMRPSVLLHKVRKLLKKTRWAAQNGHHPDIVSGNLLSLAEKLKQVFLPYETGVPAIKQNILAPPGGHQGCLKPSLPKWSKSFPALWLLLYNSFPQQLMRLYLTERPWRRHRYKTSFLSKPDSLLFNSGKCKGEIRAQVSVQCQAWH